MKLAQLANQPNYIEIGRREVSALVYKVSAISSRKAVKNIKAVMVLAESGSYSRRYSRYRAYITLI